MEKQNILFRNLLFAGKQIGGLGFRSMVDIADAAYIGSISLIASSINKIDDKLKDNLIDGFQDFFKAVEKFAVNYPEKFNKEEFDLIKLMEEQKFGIQKQLTALINNNKEMYLEQDIIGKHEPEKNGNSEDVQKALLQNHQAHKKNEINIMKF